MLRPARPSLRRTAGLAGRRAQRRRRTAHHRRRGSTRLADFALRRVSAQVIVVGRLLIPKTPELPVVACPVKPMTGATPSAVAFGTPPGSVTVHSGWPG